MARAVTRTSRRTKLVEKALSALTCKDLLGCARPNLLALQNDFEIFQFVCLFAAHLFGENLIAILGCDDYKLEVTWTRILVEMIFAAFVCLGFRIFALSFTVKEDFKLRAFYWFPLRIPDVAGKVYPRIAEWNAISLNYEKENTKRKKWDRSAHR